MLLGDRVRVLDVHLIPATRDEGDDVGEPKPWVATMSLVSDAFFVPEDSR